MNLWTDSEWKWALEPESKPEIERKHLHHRDMTNFLNYTTNSNWLSQTLSKSVSVQFYYNKCISRDNDRMEMSSWIPNQIPKLTLTTSKSVSVQFYYNKWISGIIPNGNELLNPNQNPKLKENICIIEIWPINGIIPLIRIDSHTLSMSVKCSILLQ